MLKIELNGYKLKLFMSSGLLPVALATVIAGCQQRTESAVNVPAARAPSSIAQEPPAHSETPPTAEEPPETEPNTIPTRGTLPSPARPGGNLLFSHFSDSLFFSLNPVTRTSGPRSYPSNDGAYVSEVFGHIIRSADSLARPYLQQGDHRAYYAFLVAALTVPYHESSLVHFRALEPIGRRCIASLNAGTPLRKTQALNRIFRKYFKSGSSPLIPNCDQLSPSRSTVQLLSSADFYSNGIMQVAINWHEDGYVATGAFLRLSETLRYGLGVFHKGFDNVYWNAKRYPCLTRPSSLATDRVNYRNLIRGAWAGVYNSGNTSNTCRFENRRSAWRNNDTSFLSHLDAILNGSRSPFARYLGGIERAAFEELLFNFRTGLNSRLYLDRLIRL